MRTGEACAGSVQEGPCNASRFDAPHMRGECAMASPDSPTAWRDFLSMQATACRPGMWW